jgi:hypothetical protein
MYKTPSRGLTRARDLCFATRLDDIPAVAVSWAQYIRALQLQL